MKISIVTPVLNDTRVVCAVDSILSQSHHQLELIVVDGGSTDGTLEILEGYRGHITTLISEPDNGIYDAMNKGIRHATGDVVGILNADDRYADPFVLRDAVAVFADEETDACYGDLIYVDDDEVVSYSGTLAFPERGDGYKAGFCRLGHRLILRSLSAEVFISVSEYSDWMSPQRLIQS